MLRSATREYRICTSFTSYAPILLRVLNSYRVRTEYRIFVLTGAGRLLYLALQAIIFSREC